MDLEEIKKELKPDESVLKVIASFVAKLNSSIRNKKIKANAVPGGSVAKGTFLKDDFDVDIFVKFDYSLRKEDISDMLEKVLAGKYERVHGSRDYFQVKEGSLNYELVPVLDVKKPELSENVTDMSPMHVAWVKKHLKNGQEDEIRLAKKFCKAQGVYGAESYIRGFSGHVIDILILHYGSFINLLKASQKWKAPVIIDTEKFYRNSQDVLFSMNQSKIEGPLIIIDPILKTRNASSSITYEKFALFKKKAAEFLKKPSEKFFEEPEIGKTYLRRKFKKNLVILDIQALSGKRDVVGSKLLKAFKFMNSELDKSGFSLKNAGWTWNKKKHALFWFELGNVKLPEKRIIEGPPVAMKDFADDFRKKYKKTFVKAKRVYAEIEAKGITPEKVIENASKEPYFREKARLAKIEKYI